jgi:hypothetical protein
MTLTLPNSREIKRQPGFLYWNPTDLSSEDTYGTLLGFSEAGIEFLLNPIHKVFRGEEGYNVLKLYLGSKPQIKAILKNWNQKALEACFPGVISSENILYPNTIKPGTRLDQSPYIAPLLFMPEDEGVDANIILFQEASPGTDEQGRILFSANEDSTLSVVFDCFLKGSGSENYRGFFCGKKADAVLL